MLYISYWELNEGASTIEVTRVAQELAAAGLFPPDRVDVLRWDITPDGWGMTIWEAASAADIHKGLQVWPIGRDGLFKSFKTSPASGVVEAISFKQDIETVLTSASRLPTETPDSRQTVSLATDSSESFH